MAESFVQLPPNSVGQEMRIITGDASNAIPTATAEEVVIVSDYQGFIAGDRRQAATAVQDNLLYEVIRLLRSLTLTLAMGLGTDVVTDDSEQE
jgi:hypothetical protein